MEESFRRESLSPGDDALMSLLPETARRKPSPDSSRLVGVGPRRL